MVNVLAVHFSFVVQSQESSGKITCCRLNRGGNRQANAALYRITLSRPRWDVRTHDYLDRHIIEKKNRPEMIRYLKCYIVREIYNLITTPQPETEPSAA